MFNQQNQCCALHLHTPRATKHLVF
jgi:hypothetical protein